MPDQHTEPMPSRPLDELADLAFVRYTRLRRSNRIRRVAVIALAIAVAGTSVPWLLSREEGETRRDLIDRPSEREDAGPRPTTASDDIGERSVRSGGLPQATLAPVLPGTAPRPASEAAAERIAFISHRTAGRADLYVMDGDGGSASQVSDDRNSHNDPDWSPDGKKIVFADASGDLFVVAASGGRAAILTGTDAFDSAPAWSPDNKRIAFAGRSDTDAQSDIYVTDPKGSLRKNLTATSGADESSPAWSPDGRRLVFSITTGSARGIYVMNADGSSRRRLSSGQDIEPAWSPDGATIAFTRYDTASGTPTDIYAMKADGTGIRNVTRSPATFEYGADWSPDGRSIAFTRDPDGREGTPNDPFASAVVYTATRVNTASRSAIWIMSPTGANAVALTDESDGDEAPAYRP